MKGRILNLFGELKPPTADVVDIYVECLADPSLANDATGEIMFSGPLAAKAVPALMAQLQRNYRVNDSDWRGSSTARMSLEALANIGPTASEAIPLLRSYLSDTNWMYRVAGARAYWNITGDAGTVLPVLTKALTNENQFLAADILKEMGPSAMPALDALRAGYQTGLPDTRLRSFNALVAIDPGNAPDPAGIVDLLTTPNELTRFGAAQTLWNNFHQPEQVLSALNQIASEKVKTADGLWDTMLGNSIRIIGEMGPAATEALPTLQIVLESPISKKYVSLDVNRIAASNAWIQIAPGLPVPTIKK